MKKLLSIILSLTLLSSITAYAVEYGEELKNMPSKTYEQKFSDVPQSHWAFGYIAELVNDNVLSGYPDGKFYPSNNVTRAEFAKIMISASGVKVNPATSTSFSDVAVTDWYCPYIESAKEFLTGYNYSGSAMYLPNKAAIREDIAVALVKLKGYDVSVADLGMLQTMFSDYDSISETAKRYVAVAVARGLVSGYDDGTFKGQQSITRAEAATLIWRANQYGADNKILGSETETVATSDTTTTQNQTTVTEEKKTENKVQEEKKPYVMKTIASAMPKTECREYYNTLNDGNAMTLYDDCIYYIDDEDDSVYKIDVSTGKKSLYVDTSKFAFVETEEQTVDENEEVTETVETGEYDEVEEEITETVTDEETGEEKEVTKTVTKQVPKTKEVTKTVSKSVKKDVVTAKYTDFCSNQIYYDYNLKKMFLIGYYKNITKPYQSEVQNKRLITVYDISSKNPVLYEQVDSEFRYDSLDIFKSYVGYFDGELRKYDGIYPSSLIIKNNNAYILDYDRKLKIEKYSFNKGYFDNVSGDGIQSTYDYKGYAVGTDCYYCWNYDDTFSKILVSDGTMMGMTINLKEDNVEFADMGSLGGISKRFFVIDDKKIVFYDKNMYAFRVLQKNK